MRCEVELVLREDAAVSRMGVKAAKSVNGECRDGDVTVRRVGVPTEISRQEV